MALGPLKQFGITKVIVTTMQAISGAGYPGVASMDIMGNVIPFIGGEEEKMEKETQKILGDFAGDHIEPLAAKVSAHCNRVAVVDGHTETVSVEFSSKPTEADLRQALETSAACRSSAIFPARRRAPSSTWTRPTARSRAKTPSASAAWRPSWDACAPATCSITNSSCSATTPSAARPAPPC